MFRGCKKFELRFEMLNVFMVVAQKCMSSYEREKWTYRVSTKPLDNLKNLLILQLTLEMPEMFK